MNIKAILPEKPVAWWNRQHLIGKFTAILMLCAVAFVPMVYLGLLAVLEPTFDRIEAKTVADQANRARHSLKVYNENLISSVSDYAIWDGSYNYMLKPDPAFIADTLSPTSYQNMGVDVTGYVTNDRVVRFSNAVDRSGPHILADETRFFATYFSKGRIFDETQRNGVYSDYVRTRRGLFLVNAQKAVHSDMSGPSVGIVGMGILLDAKSLSEALQVNVTLHIDPTPAESQELQHVADHTAVSIYDDHRTTQIGLTDGKGRVIAFIEYNVPRNAKLVGQRAILFATLAMMAFMLLLICIVSLSIRCIAVGRLNKLEQQVIRMRQGDFEITSDLVVGDDEISRLAREFVQFDEELDSANTELRRQAYIQGKADSAAGMLHNVRNAMAPLRVVQDRWLSDERQDFRINMERATAEIDSPDCTGERREALHGFLASAAMEIARGGPRRRATIEEAKSTVDQIAAILGSYDFDTSGNKPREPVDPLKVVQQEARALMQGRTSSIAIVTPDSLPLVQANRVQLGQVIGNLMVNASEAILAAAPDDPQITVSASTLPDGRVEIRIADNGDGIAPDKLPAVFERGYSTRKSKSGGLGMHWSSIAIRSMGGELAIESPGKGHGAVALVRLPGADQEFAAAA